MIINNIDGQGGTLVVQPSDDSYCYRELMGENSLTLIFSSPTHVELAVGSYVDFQGRRYTLERPENLKMKHSRAFEYSVLFEGIEASLKKYKLRDVVYAGAWGGTRRLKFTLTAKPIEFLRLVVNNLNYTDRDTGWSADTTNVLDATEKTISFNHNYVYDALQTICEEFETEFEIGADKVIHIGKVEYNKDNPLSLSYGKGNGFKPGIERTNFEDKMPVEVLYCEGGDKNIDSKAYGSTTLHLPRTALGEGQLLGYDGSKFSNEAGYDATKARVYTTDGEGYCITRYNKPLTNKAEESLDCTDIYPKRDTYYADGENKDVVVTKAVVIDADGEEHDLAQGAIADDEKNLYDIFDTTIPEHLDYSDCRLAGETMRVHFNSGLLAGREFDIQQEENGVSGYVHSERRFKLCSIEEDGTTLPNSVNYPRSGDRYVVLGCSMPQSYIGEAEGEYNVAGSTRVGAEWDMMRECIKYLYEHEDLRFSFTGELDGKWAKSDWENIGGKLVLGGYISFIDDRFQTTAVLIRINAIKQYINNPHSPEITLSNETVGSTVSSALEKLENEEVHTDNLHREALSFTKRRFRDAQETMSLLETALLGRFTNAISPITVQTMSALVGDESLQFRFESVGGTVGDIDVAFDSATKVLSVGLNNMTTLRHLTLGVDYISSAHDTADCQTWAMSRFNSSALDEDAKAYYLYAKCEREDTNSDGIKDGTFILSDTAIAMSSDADYYHFLCGILNSAYEGDRSYVSMYGFTEILPGRITTDKIVSSDGNSFFDMLLNKAHFGNSSSYIDWNNNNPNTLRVKGMLVQSQSGDESVISCWRGSYDAAVIYYVGDEVSYEGSTYRCTAQTTGGVAPTNTSYWSLVAEKGDTGSNGDKGAALVFRGVYKSDATYYGNSVRVDAVKYGNYYYVAKPTAGTFSGKIPTDTTKWSSFGAQFDSIATGLLFAAVAFIENLGVEFFRTGTDGARIEISKDTNSVEIFDSAGTKRLSIDGNTQTIFCYDSSGNIVVTMGNSDVPASPSALGGGAWATIMNTMWAAGTFPDGEFERNDGEGILVNTYDQTKTAGNFTLSQSSNISFRSNLYPIFSSETPEYSMAVTADIYKKLAGDSYVKVISDLAEDTTSASALAAGTYRIDVTLSISSTIADRTAYPFSIYHGNTNVVAQAGANMNMFGKNGFYSYWGANNYVFYNNDYGFQVRIGSYAFKISTSGIQKSTNGGSTWTTL